MNEMSTLLRPILAEAGELALNYYLRASHTIKADHTPVTEADLSIQSFLIEALSRYFPDDGIVAEEGGMRRPAAAGERCWTVDPIDGTIPFMAGMANWSIAVGLIDHGEAVAGFVYMPATGDCFHTCGGGVFRNERAVSMKPNLQLNTDSILLSHTRPHQYYELKASFPGRIFCLGAASVHLSLVASGGADVVLIGHDKIWDLAPGLALLKANGGELRYLDGTPCGMHALLSGKPAPLPMLGGRPSIIAALQSHLDYFAPEATSPQRKKSKRDAK